MPLDRKQGILLVLLGPTAVGKSALSLELAARLNGEIVSADSRLFYRGMDVGTAKPSAKEQAQVRHHLIDVAEPNERWSLAQFQEAAYAAIDEIHGRAKLPLLVGGSGQYVRAVTEGWLPPELPAQPELRRALERWGQEIGVEKLHRKLASLDALAASRMDPRNLRRIVRALEVIFSSGRLFSEQSQSKESRFHLIQLGLMRSREALYARIDQRIQQMMAGGWLAEVEQLLKRDFSAQLASMSAIGYAQLAAHLQGDMDLDEAEKIIKRKSRAFVRRQANWFKADDPNIIWFDAGAPNVLDDIEAEVHKVLDRYQAAT